MSDELFSREEILGGAMVGRRAAALLRALEVRTSYLVVELRKALWLLLNKRIIREGSKELDYLEEIRLSVIPNFQISIHDIERWAPDWRREIPDDPRVLAVLVNLFAAKYQFAERDIPQIKAALGLDRLEVREAFESQYGRPLTSIYAASSPPDAREFWLKSLDWLTPESLRDVEHELEWVYLPWGETLFEQGDYGDRLYVTVSGRMRVLIRDSHGVERVVREMGRGESFGETAVITDEPRSATIIAIRDTELVSITRAGMDGLVSKHPGAIIQIARQLFSRLQDTTPDGAAANLLSTIALVPASPDVPCHEFGDRLAKSLQRYGTTVHLDQRLVDEALGEGASQIAQEHRDNNRMMWWLNEHEVSSRFILYEAEPELTEWTRRCLRGADLILIVGNADTSSDLGEIEARLFRADLELDRVATTRELVLLHRQRVAVVKGTATWLDRQKVKRHHHMSLHTREDFDRLARFLTGNAVGVVLGGGASRGIAHLGVLRALNEAGIPIDVIGGTSMGALVAAGYLAVTSYEEEFRRYIAQARSLFRPTLPIMSLINGRRLSQLFIQSMGDTLIEDLWLPYFAVSSNLTKAEMVVHQRGLLWRAVRASISLPTILPPVREGGDLLVDGGVFNNLPVDVMSRVIGGGRVIASNVSPWHEVDVEYDYDDDVSGAQILWRRINPFISTLKVPNLIFLISRTMIVGSSHRWKLADQAAIKIEPELRTIGMYAPEDYDRIVAIGYRTACEVLDANREQIREWLN